MVRNPFWCGKEYQNEPGRECPTPNPLTLVSVLPGGLYVGAEGWESLSGPVAPASTSEPGRDVVDTEPRGWLLASSPLSIPRPPRLPFNSMLLILQFLRN